MRAGSKEQPFIENAAHLKSLLQRLGQLQRRRRAEEENDEASGGSASGDDDGVGGGEVGRRVNSDAVDQGA